MLFLTICLVLGAMLIIVGEILYSGEKAKREKAKEIEPETSKDEEGE